MKKQHKLDFKTEHPLTLKKKNLEKYQFLAVFKEF
jgi:hypothetical protein